MNHETARIGLIINGELPATLQPMYWIGSEGITQEAQFFIDMNCRVDGYVLNGVVTWFGNAKCLLRGDVFNITHEPGVSPQWFVTAHAPTDTPASPPCSRCAEEEKHKLYEAEARLAKMQAEARYVNDKIKQAQSLMQLALGMRHDR